MKARKLIATISAVTVMASFALCACGKDENKEESETTEAKTEATTEAPTESTFPTGRPIDSATYVEFDEPVAYEVITAADAYEDMTVQTYAMTYPEGSMVVGLATDGYYVVLDNGYVVLAENLFAYQ